MTVESRAKSSRVFVSQNNESQASKSHIFPISGLSVGAGSIPAAKRAFRGWASMALALVMAILAGVFAPARLSAQASSWAPAPVMITVAGIGGPYGYSGDTGLATSAKLGYPYGFASDAQGNFYIADTYNARVRKVNAKTGIITTVAGNGTAGHAGDGGVATSAEINYPYGVAVDSNGNIYIADTGNNVIRVVYVSGSIPPIPNVASPVVGDIYTLAGDGTPGYSGDGSTATSAELQGPQGVALDSSGNVYIADTANNVIRMVSATTGDISTVAGNHAAGAGFSGDAGAATSAKLSGPSGVAVDSSGDIFIADQQNNRIRVVTSGSGSPNYNFGNTAGDIYTYAGSSTQGYNGDNGEANSAELYGPFGVVLDNSGNVYISDSGNNVIREVNGATGVISTVAGNHSSTTFINGGAATISGLSGPQALAVDSKGDIYIADTSHNEIQEVVPATNFGNVNVCPGSQSTPAPCSQTYNLTYTAQTTTNLGTPTVVTQGVSNLDFEYDGGTCSRNTIQAGNTCFVQVTFYPTAPGLRAGAVNLFDNATPANLLASTPIEGIAQGPVAAFAPAAQTVLTPSVSSTGLNNPVGVAVDAAGDIFIGDRYNGRVVEIPYGGAATTIGTGLITPYGVAVDGAGDVFIADTNYGGNGSVVEVPAGGGTQTTVVSGLNSPQGVAVDAEGDVFISDSVNNRILEVSATGTQTELGVSVLGPSGLAVDAAGDLFIADVGNDRIVKFPAGCASSSCQTTVGSGIGQAYDVAADAAGDVFIADSSHNRVVEVPAGGGAQFTVGTGLGFPSGVALDATGNIYIGDTSNNRIVEVTASTPPALTYSSSENVATSAQSVSIQNVGNEPLTAVSPGLGFGTGTNFTKVAGSGSPADCTATFSLTSGAQCNVSIEFNPQATGTLTDTYTFTDNAINTIPSTTQSISLTGNVLTPQTINWTANPPSSAAYDSSFTVAASVASGLTVTYSASGGCSNALGVYTMTSSTVSCVVTVSQAGDATHGAVTASKTVTATLANQFITVGTAPPNGPIGYGSSFTVAASSTYGSVSGGVATGLTVAYGAAGGCSVNSGTGIYTMTSASTSCTVTISQQGNADYNPATNASYTVTATLGTPTVSATGNTCSYNNSACSGSGSVTDPSGNTLTPAVTLSYAGSGSTTYPASSTAPTAAGTYTLTVSFAGNSNYNSGSNTAAVTINQGGSSVSISCTNGAPFTYSGLSQQPCTATVSGAGGLSTTVTVSYPVDTTDAGSISVSAYYPGDSNHIGNGGTGGYTIAKANTLVQVNCPPTVTYNGSAQTPCTASVSGPNNFSQSLTPNYPATNINAGPVSVSASFGGNSNYNSSGNGSGFEILQAPQTISVTSYPPTEAYGASFTVSASGGGSGNSLVYTSSGGCSNNGSSYTMTSGTTACTIIINQSGNGNYSSATQVTESVTASLATQGTITVTGPSGTLTYGGTAGTATYSGGSGNGTLSFSAGTSSGCSVGGTTVTVSNASGTCSITVTKGSDGNYASATSSAFSVTLAKATPSAISFSPSSPVIYGILPIALSATGGGSSSPVTFSIASGPGSLSGINGSTLTVAGATPSSIVIYANQAGDNNYNAASQVSATVTVNKATPVVTLASDSNPVQAPNPVTLTATVSGPQPTYAAGYGATAIAPSGRVTFYEAGTRIGSAAVSNGVAVLTTTLGVGTEPITATYAGDVNFGTNTSAALNQVVNNLNPNIGGGDQSNFGSVEVGSTKTQNVVLTFPTALTLNTVTPSGDFTILSDSCSLPASLSAGATCTLSVKFAPTQPGQRWFPVVAADNNGDNYSFGLEGTGVGPALAFAPGVITAFAGNGTAGSTGNGAAAALAELSGPSGSAVDGLGNVYIADTVNNVVRKVTASTGFISTVAGNGTAGYSRDGFAATSAELDQPSGVALDSAGNLYIADSGNDVIRKVDANGIITTVAGNNTIGYSGDGDAAISAQLNDPSDVAVDASGNLYIADTLNNVIRKVSGGVITTIAGNGTYGYNGDDIAATNANLYSPTGVVLDATGNLYIADSNNNRVREVSLSGNITTVAGNGNQGYSGDGGTATSAQLSYPVGVAIDGTGSLYIADTLNNRIRKVSSGNITTVAGGGAQGTGSIGNNGAATSAQLDQPDGVIVDNSGNLYIVDSGNNVVREVGVTSALSLAFANAEVGNTSSDSPKSVKVVNVGNQLLEASGAGLAITGDGGASYSQVAGSGSPADCTASSSLTPGTACNLSLSFKPTTYGSLLASVVFTDNSLNVSAATQTIQLSGYGYGAPVITVQPTNQTTNAGNTATFSVTATGTATLTYQWQYLVNGNWAVFAAGTNLTSATMTTMATTSRYNGLQLRVVVTDGNGNSTNSNAVTLTVNSPPVITSQPTSQTVTVGSTASFSVTATGTPTLTYAWQYLVNGNWAAFAAGTNLTSATMTTLNTTARYNGLQLRVVVTDGNGNSTTSNVVTLTVNSPPVITAQPSSPTVTVGSTATFSVTATGTPTLTYAWQYLVNGNWAAFAAGTNLTSATMTTMATTSRYNGLELRVVVTDGNGLSTTSTPATLTVNPNTP